jgi:hypothetical protein
MSVVLDLVQFADDGSSSAMKSFKTFLGSQDGTITDDEAINKYAEYKL